ncbi:unknown [Firmicutes bacterium CAG:212]|jgi:hypothetical protein|nr:unknown [Firmicutes bacterium CAG:212]
MQIFEGEYLQAEKKQVADVYSCKLIEKKASARVVNKLMQIQQL